VSNWIEGATSSEHKESLLAVLNLISALPLDRSDIVKSRLPKVLYDILLDENKGFCSEIIEKLLSLIDEKTSQQKRVSDSSSSSSRRRGRKVTWAKDLVVDE
jgi:hypothetical protein